jgi:hypothetical protein
LFQSDGFLQKIYVEIYDLVVDKSFSGVAGDEQYSALRTAAILRSSEPRLAKVDLGISEEGLEAFIQFGRARFPRDLQLCRNQAEARLPKA